MFSDFFSNRQRRAERAHLTDVIDYCHKRLRQDGDLLSTKQDAAFRKEIQRAQNLMTAGSEGIPEITDALIDACNQVFPPSKAPLLSENGEAVLVALVIAVAIQAFFFQPFKIPTGSMQPTLNGITVRPATEREKSWWYKWVSLPLFGERVIHYTAESDGMVHSPAAIKFKPLHYGGKHGFFNFLPMEAVEFYVGKVRYTLPMDSGKFNSEVLGGNKGVPPYLLRGHEYKKGETIIDCVVKTGDQLFVDKFTYHFRKPRRADVFVFKTGDIPNPGGDFYIKRLAGIPGDLVKISDPNLYIDGKIADHPGFQRVMSRQNGYEGYTAMVAETWKDWRDGHQIKLSVGEYFALGDNSFNSRDSRCWGPVTYPNIIGRGFFVYWPFTPHFGRVE